jgi:16S rRNA A1518/A1519 N6-dimethyltransferase RsmA/KsgA/DIM1 with predicted DNA glycosylase/AP lyase activity
VADLGAGTGKVTGSLIAPGLVVDAIEPDPAMMAVLTRECPQATPHLADALARHNEDDPHEDWQLALTGNQSGRRSDEDRR